jgi:uncharacterized protein
MLLEQRLSVITLGVHNLAASKAFYTNGLGWNLAKKSQDALAVFQLGGIALCLFEKQALLEDVGLALEGGFSGITLAYNARSKTEVDSVLLQAKNAGGHSIKPAQDVFWGGYSGYFSDLDGHVFEVAWNPFWPLDERGNIDVS